MPFGGGPDYRNLLSRFNYPHPSECVDLKGERTFWSITHKGSNTWCLLKGGQGRPHKIIYKSRNGESSLYMFLLYAFLSNFSNNCRYFVVGRYIIILLRSEKIFSTTRITIKSSLKYTRRCTWNVKQHNYWQL